MDICFGDSHTFFIDSHARTQRHLSRPGFLHIFQVLDSTSPIYTVTTLYDSFLYPFRTNLTKHDHRILLRPVGLRARAQVRTSFHLAQSILTKSRLANRNHPGCSRNAKGGTRRHQGRTQVRQVPAGRDVAPTCTTNVQALMRLLLTRNVGSR